MPNAANLFKKEQKDKIIEAIRSAEKNTSAELRVHIENHCKKEVVMDRAIDVFGELGMHNTALRNGVLIYVAVKDRKTAIIGDRNVHINVNPMFWSKCYTAMREHFAKEEFMEGICTAIEMLEAELVEHFPHQDDDVNELPDDISIG